MPTFGDHVRWGSPEDQSAALTDLSRQLIARANEIAAATPRTEASAVHERLLRAAAGTVDLVAKDSVDAPLPVLALATRNLFEINLRARHVMASEANLRRWLSEVLLDRIHLYEGILTLGGSEELRGQILKEIEDNRALARKHGLALKGSPMHTSQLAEEVGMQQEYTGLFKFYSKLLHPTSYAVNVSPAEVGSLVNRNILLGQLQLYGHDLLGRSQQWFGAPTGAA